MKLWLDDMRPLPTEPGWVLARSVNEAIEIMKKETVSFASLDHDLGYFASEGGDGVKLILWMAENESWPTEGIQIHSMNPVGAQNMMALVERYAPYKASRRSTPF